VVVVHLARSGDSPESRAALEALLAAGGDRVRHLVITCNADGALARLHAGDPRLFRVVLDARTNDRSLVMTSSFTNLVLAGRALAYGTNDAGYRAAAARVAEVGRRVLADHADALGELAARGFHAAVHLGTAGHFGAAREASLKMLEMSAGRLLAFPETFLGLRHGPMSAVHSDTLAVAYLSADPVARGYELDLLRELRRKQPAAPLVVVGEQVPPEALGGGLAVSPPGLEALGDDERVLIDALVAQLLAFSSCLRLGLRPDAPSPDGMIARVVGDFPIHG
jgi:tagatose-6-phosphate ketose/aldose isomerase